MRTRQVVLMAAAGLALASGCGLPGGEPQGSEGNSRARTPAEPLDLGSGPPEAGPDPCSLLTDDEVAEAIGTTVIEVLGPHELTLHTACQWAFRHEGSGRQAAVNVEVWLGDAHYLPEAGPDADHYEPVAGIGDEAAAWSGGDLAYGGPGCEVFFRTGQIVVRVAILQLVPEDTCVNLARAAGGRV